MLTIYRGVQPSGYGYYNWTPTGCYADEILYSDARNRHGAIAMLHAMSIIGPEQQVRSISAFCGMAEGTRARFRFKGQTTAIDGVWAGLWRCRATVLHGAMHLVAMPEVKVAANEDDPEQTHIIIAQEPTAASLQHAIYRRLVACYSTPLIPVDQPGQPAEEREAGLIWQRTIVSSILGMKSCTRLHTHTDAPGRWWSMAVRLRLGNQTLDDLVSQLCRNGALPFPTARRASPRPSSPEAPSIDSPCLLAAT